MLPQDDHSTSTKMLNISDLCHMFDNTCKSFPLSSKHIKVLETPHDFFNHLQDCIQDANSHISLASLYLGNDEKEKRLVYLLDKRMEKVPALTVSIILDHSRGQRGKEASSVAMLRPLIQRYPKRIKVWLFRSPNLQGLLRSRLPSPWNETLGVFHVKAYLFDDNLIMSGANLSHDYFTNRQDRYIVFSKARELSKFYFDLIQQVGAHCYSVTACPGSKESTIVPPEHSIDKLGRLLTSIFAPTTAASNGVPSHNSDLEDNDFLGSQTIDTMVYPTVQLSPLGVKHDEMVTQNLLAEAAYGCGVTIASGYLNFSKHFIRILKDCRASITVVTAAPEANGFYKAKGIAQSIPTAYSLIEEDFFKAWHEGLRHRRGKHGDRALYEYQRKGWTYHSKGLWMATPEEKVILCTIGSPNFGRRSYEKDFESQLFLLTKSPGLRKLLAKEQDSLLKHSRRVTQQTFQDAERRLHGWGWRNGRWIKLAKQLVAAYL